MAKLRYLFCCLAAMFWVQQAGAFDCTPTYCEAPIGSGAAKQTTTRWYTGLVWDLGGIQGMKPDVVVGIRSLTVNDIDSVHGSDMNLRFKLTGSAFSLDSARVAYVGGTTQLLANAGLGYSFTNASPFVTAAVQPGYFRLGTDYLFAARRFKFFGEINTLEKPEKVGTGELSCANAPKILTDVGSVGGTVPDNAIVNGQTCYDGG